VNIFQSTVYDWLDGVCDRCSGDARQMRAEQLTSVNNIYQNHHYCDAVTLLLCIFLIFHIASSNEQRLPEGPPRFKRL
jgi:hypothetical protein